MLHIRISILLTCLVFYGVRAQNAFTILDSLNGFNLDSIKTSLKNKNLTSYEQNLYINSLERTYIRNKFYKIEADDQVSTKYSSNNAISSFSPCNNLDFEATTPGIYTTSTAVAGWTISNQQANSCSSSTVWSPGSAEFSVVSTPIVGIPYIGYLPQSPLGGNTIVKLNDYLNNQYRTKIATTINVTSANSLFQYAFAGLWQDGNHLCCEQSNFQVMIKNCQGVVLSCYTNSLIANGISCSAFYYNKTAGFSWTNWQTKTIDLSPFVGTCIILEVINSDCIFAGHYGTAFFDATCNPPSVGQGIVNGSSSGYVSYCSGTSQAQVTAPFGYSNYQWKDPSNVNISAPQGTMAVLTLTNPVPGSVYSVTFTNGNCNFSSSYTIVPTQVAVAGIGSTGTCTLASMGSATIQGMGSNIGYNYAWYNSTGSVVGTNSIITNLSPGTYSAVIAAPGCGSASATTTVMVNANPAPTYLAKPYCGSQVFFTPLNGSNFQWYSGTVTIPASQGGIASGYTTAVQPNDSIFGVAYINSQGCRDSIVYLIYPASPGTISVISNTTACPAHTTTASLILNPSTSFPSSFNSFTITSINASPPIYFTYTSSPGMNNMNNLLAGNLYSVNGFDGSCYTNTTFSIGSVIPNPQFTVTPPSATVCSGTNVQVVMTGQVPSNTVYFFTLTPSTFAQTLTPGPSYLLNATITPIIPSGTYSTFVYTIVGQDYWTNCIINSGFSVSVSSPLTPTINPINILCPDTPSYAIIATPGGGTFISQSGINTPINPISGIITPSLSSIGTNYFIYLISTPGCSVSTTGSYVYHQPIITITGSDSLICAGVPVVLSASGAITYTWTNSVIISNSIIVNPSVSTTYTAIGEDMYGCKNSNSFLIQVDPCTYLKTSDNESYILYPNPTNDLLIIELANQSNNVGLKIFNAIGQLIIKQNLVGLKNWIMLGELPKGIYYALIFEGNNLIKKEKIIVD
jgi:hypothetical protein